MVPDLISASSIAGVLVLIRKLYQEGAVNAEEKGQLKDAVLGNHNEVLLSSFVRFVADGDKEALVAALLSVLGQHNPKLAGPVSSPAVYGDDDEHDSVTAAALQQRQELIDQYQIIQAQAQQLELRKQYLLHEQAKLRQLQEQTHRAAAQQYGRWDDYDDGQDDEDDDAAEDGSAEKYRYAAQMVESYDRAAEQTGGDRFDDEYGYDGDDRDDDEAAEPEHNHPLLSLTSLDLPCIRHNLVESGFSDVDLRDLWMAFEDDSLRAEGLDHAKLRRCQLKLINYHQNPRFLSAFMNHICVLLDRNRNGVIDFAELLCALALICHGSQTQKMRFVFELLDYDSDGLISLAELFRFLYAFAATIATLRSPTLAAMLSEEEDEEARASVWEEAEAMFEAAELDTQTDIDFEEFSAWADNPVGLLDALVGSIMG